MTHLKYSVAGWLTPGRGRGQGRHMLGLHARLVSSQAGRYAELRLSSPLQCCVRLSPRRCFQAVLLLDALH